MKLSEKQLASITAGLPDMTAEKRGISVIVWGKQHDGKFTQYNYALDNGTSKAYILAHMREYAIEEQSRIDSIRGKRAVEFWAEYNHQTCHLTHTGILYEMADGTWTRDPHQAKRYDCQRYESTGYRSTECRAYVVEWV